MEAEHASTATVDMLGPVVTNVVASTQSRNTHVGKKLTPTSVNVHMEDSHADLLTSQYLNLHRVPDSLAKGLDSGVINGELLAHHVVDLASQADFPQHNVTQQYYETDDLLSPDMTDEDKNLAAALVTVQLIQQQKHQQHHQNIDLLGTKTMAPLSAVPPVGMDKPAMAAMVSYIQAVEEEAAQQQLLEQQHSRILKMYQPTVPTQLQEMKLQPLPPLKKVLSSQSMGNHSKYVRHFQTQVVTTMAQMNNIELPQELQAAPENRAVVEAMGGGGEDGGDTDYEAEGEMMRPQRRNLPHKKRIAKKLKTPTPTAVRNIHTKCYKCNKCGESFANQSAFSTHRTMHTAVTAKRPAALPPAPPPVTPAPTATTVVTFYACEICGHQSSNQLRFFEHLKSHYEPSQLTAVGDTVEVVIVDPVAVTESTTTETDHLPLNQPCRPTITHAYTIKSESEQIVKEEEEEEEDVGDGGVYNCQQCNKNFRRATALASHMSVAHRTQDEIEEFSEPEDMMEGLRHVVNIQGDDSGEEEPTDDKMRVWRYSEMGLGIDLDGMVMLPHHVGGTEGAHDLGGDIKKRRGARKGGAGRTLGCTQCDRTFNHRNSLLYHVRSHSGQRPYQCDVCGKSFFSASALKVHLRTHSGDKPYKCAYCGRHFRQWGDLKYHCVSLHSFKKQFQCEFCGKDFARKYSLIVHRRIHTGERNYRCEFCNKSFRASSYLQNHRRIHTGEKPHSCDICGKPFRVRSDMRRHRNTHARDRSGGGGTVPTESSSNRSNHHSSDEEEEPESILPDGNSTPLNLNVRQTDSDDGLAYTRDSLDRENSPLFVWIPTENQSLLPDE